jgi:hypothetical protein
VVDFIQLTDLFIGRPLTTCGALGCGTNEQNVSSRRYCHPSRELFRAGDLLFFHFIARQTNSRSPAPLLDFRMAAASRRSEG